MGNLCNYAYVRVIRLCLWVIYAPMPMGNLCTYGLCTCLRLIYAPTPTGELFALVSYSPFSNEFFS
jgi:hypothetical protein